MIVPSMNSQELYSEIMNDKWIVKRKAYHLALSLRRSALKSKHKHVRETFEYMSKQRNNWIITIDSYVKGYESSAAVYFIDRHGLNGICVNTDGLSLSHFTPHFLERYNERFLKDPMLTKLVLLKQFISNNPVAAISVIPESGTNHYEIFGRFNDGVGLGSQEVFGALGNNIVHFKTFISNEMVVDCQRGGFNILGEIYDDTCEEFQKVNMRRA